MPWHWLFFALPESQSIFWSPPNKMSWVPEVALVDFSPNGRPWLWILGWAVCSFRVLLCCIISSDGLKIAKQFVKIPMPICLAWFIWNAKVSDIYLSVVKTPLENWKEMPGHAEHYLYYYWDQAGFEKSLTQSYSKFSFSINTLQKIVTVKK